MKDKLKDFTEVSNTFTKMVKADSKDDLEIEIGDSEEADFKPQIKIKKWDNEVNFSMRAVEGVGAVAVVEDGKVKYKGRDIEVHQYEKPDAGEDGGYEFEWVLKKKPESNVLRTTIQHKGLDFFYQPEITDEEALASMFDGDKRTLEEIKREMRPENVVGSYAVYHKTKRDNRPDKHYKTGKAFHIYRPHAVDADGVEVWCELDITEGELTVTVPENYLAKAKYPVVVDPTFGYTSAGASTYGLGGQEGTNLIHSKYELTEAGEVTKITAFLNRVSENHEVKMGIFDDDGLDPDSVPDGRPGGRLASRASVTVSATSFTEYDTSSFSLSLGSGDYFLSASGDAQGPAFFGIGPVSIAGDATGGESWIVPNQEVSTSDPAFFRSFDASNSRKYSIYATYTASGGGGGFTPTPQMHMMAQAGGLM